MDFTENLSGFHLFITKFSKETTLFFINNSIFSQIFHKYFAFKNSLFLIRQNIGQLITCGIIKSDGGGNLLYRTIVKCEWEIDEAMQEGRVAKPLRQWPPAGHSFH